MIHALTLLPPSFASIALLLSVLKIEEVDFRATEDRKKKESRYRINDRHFNRVMQAYCDSLEFDDGLS